jgi:hypothetical protein
MSLKENINYIKEEISAEENYMEKFFKTEQFLKKYKKIVYGLTAVIIVSTIGFYASSYIALQNKIKTNQAFNSLLENPNDKNAIAILKENNPKLLKISVFMQDQTKTTDVEFLKELNLYSLAIKENNIDKLSSVSQSQDFLLKDFATFNKALIQTKNKKYQNAKESLKLISTTSQIAALSKMLNHFLLTK